MLNEINEDYIRKIIQRELEKFYFSEEKDKKHRETRAFLGRDTELKFELEKTFLISEESDILIVSNLSLKNLYNLSNGIYENDFEEKIIKQVLNAKKVILIEEGLEYKQYKDIPKKLLEKYNIYIKNLKDYGIKIEKREIFLKQISGEEEIYLEKLLDLKTMTKLVSEGRNTIKLSENSIITSSAIDYAKENNIIVIKGR